MTRNKLVDTKKLAGEILEKSQNGKDTGELLSLIYRTYNALKSTENGNEFSDVIEIISGKVSGKVKHKATVTSPVPLETTQKEVVLKFLEKKFKEKFEIDEIVNTKMGGGIIIEYKDFILDLSLENKIKELLR